jgi:hypothetical protein
LRIPQFSNRRFVFWLPSSEPPICTGDQLFSLAFRSCLRLAPLADLRLCLPTQRPTLIGCQILQLALQLISSSRLQPALPLNLLADPSTCVSVSALRTAFRFNLRLASPAVPLARLTTCLKARAPRLIVRLRFPAGLQLAPSTDPPALPSNLTSDSSVAASFGFAFLPPFGLRLQSTFRLCLPASFQLAPSADFPALPSNVQQLAPLNDSGLRLRANLQLAPSIDLPAHRCVDLQLAPLIPLSGSACLFASSLRWLPTFKPCL